jgi:potassium-transporting ATPase KdpC subunit
MLSELKPAILMTLILTLLTGLIYPFAITGVAQLLFPHQANGSLITTSGRTVGSSLIGQNFAKPEYFHPRPSAAGQNGYDAASSGGSNLSPTNPALTKRLSEAAAALLRRNLLIYGLGGIVAPFPGIWIIDRLLGILRLA